MSHGTYPLDRRVKVLNGMYKGFEGIVIKKSPSQVFVEMVAVPAESKVKLASDKPTRKWLPSSFVEVIDEPPKPDEPTESGEKAVTRVWKSYEVTALFDTDNPQVVEVFMAMVESLHVLGGIRDLDVEKRVVEE